ncbi:HNH endonuclease [Actinoallomurus purpureus]|uniref:HNH endonuclease signature motif containing protein n=1 Tax=Actinoallomurus purpureus TaxID=478114 RepID=UPI0020931041|nr:HNH endonuclease signature motif containing protein [Actinoallomurus purpureus]MCO6008044.1 HNH endonuclease [Actinoallomurus purpureus]
MAQKVSVVPSFMNGAAWDRDPRYVWPGEFLEEPAPVLWFDDALDVDASDLQVPPGPGSAAALAGMDPGRLDGDGLLTAIGAWRRLGAWAKAGEVAAVATFLEERARRGGGVEAFESAVGEIQLELTLTGWGAARLLELACPLADKLPGTMEALGQGLIDEAKARVIARAVDGLVDGATARLVERRVLPEAPEQTTGQLRSAVRRAVIEADPGAAERRSSRAEAGRRVEVRATDDHTADLCGRDLPADQALAADNRITALARALKTDGAPHSLGFLRAQVFLDLLLGTGPAPIWPPVNSRPGDQLGAEPTDEPDDIDRTDQQMRAADQPEDLDDLRAPGASRPASKKGIAGTVHLIVPIGTLLGTADLPGEVRGHGAVPASMARAIAATATGRRWCYTVIDPAGRAIGHGHIPPPPDGDEATRPQALADLITAQPDGQATNHGREHRTGQTNDPDKRNIQGTYRPPESLRHIVETRDRTCRFPACRRPAQACDLDHTIPYDQGGVTCECNLAPLCRKHHRLKASAGWTLLHPEPGQLVWVTPTGRKYFAGPDPYM